jgi:hypothetical protein
MEYKKLTVMADFCSSGIWKNNTSTMVDFEDLNLPKELVKKFEDWIEFYDRKCHKTRHFIFVAEKAEELNTRGKELAKKLKIHLPNVQITYRGEIDGGMLEEEEIIGD